MCWLNVSFSLQLLRSQKLANFHCHGNSIFLLPISLTSLKLRYQCESCDWSADHLARSCGLCWTDSCCFLLDHVDWVSIIIQLHNLLTEWSMQCHCQQNYGNNLSTGNWNNFIGLKFDPIILSGLFTECSILCGFIIYFSIYDVWY